MSLMGGDISNAQLHHLSGGRHRGRATDKVVDSAACRSGGCRYIVGVSRYNEQSLLNWGMPLLSSTTTVADEDDPVVEQLTLVEAGPSSGQLDADGV
jgi:hypothetical protein